MTPLSTVARRTALWPFRMWAFGEAAAIDGLLEAGAQLGQPEYEAHVAALCLASVGRGLGQTPDDHMAPGRGLIALHRLRGDQRFLDGARRLIALHEDMPRNPAGALLVRAHQAGWRHQIWVDSLDLIGPLFAHFAGASGEDARFQQAADLTLAHLRCLQADGDLPSHGFDTHAGRNGHLWARGAGWALMGLADTCALLPTETPGRDELAQRLARMLSAVADHQHPSGLWTTVLDRPESYEETTLAAMFAVAVHRARQARLIDTRFDAAADAARQAVRAHVDDDGALALVSEATPVGQFSTYATRPFGVFPWGQGPLLLMECLK